VSIMKRPAAPPKLVTIEFQLEEPLLTTLKAYCEFIDSTPHHVIATALRLVFKKGLRVQALAERAARLPETPHG
jgi:hypothetical protein